VTIEVTSCPKDRTKWKKSFEIYPVGLEEKLTVNLNLMCECDCEKPGQEVYMCTFKRISVHIMNIIVYVLIINGLQLSKFGNIFLFYH